MQKADATFLFRWFQEVWNQGKKNSIDELLAEDVIAHGLGPEGQLKGIEAFKKFYDDFREQLKNIRVDVEEAVCQDDMETALCHVTALDIATGKSVEFSGLCMVKIANGKIVQAWNHYDFLKMYQQLGYTLAPSQPMAY